MDSYDSNSVKIYIGNIGQNTDEDSLRTCFEKYGETSTCKLIEKDGRRFAFIEYQDSSSVNDAISGMNQQDLDGQRITVAQAGAKKPSYGGGSNSYGGGSNSYGGGSGGGQCYTCKEEGHMSRNCPNRDSSQGSSSNGCFNCGESGHFKSNCPNPPKSSNRGGYGGNNGGSSSSGGYQESSNSGWN